MRIAHVANFYGPTSGGLRTAMHALGQGYRELGHEVLLVVPGASDHDEQTDFGRRITVRSPVLPLSGGYRVITRVGAVRGLLQDFSPDVLEVSDRTTLRSLGAWGHQRGIPSAFFAHERADGVLAAFVPRGLRKVVPLARLADAHNRGTAHRFTTIVCTTSYAAAEFDRAGLDSVTIALGVDLEAFHPRSRSQSVRDQHAPAAVPLVVMASRLSAEKAPHIAIDAVRELGTRGIDVRLASVGTGAIESKVRDSAQGLPVEFLGFVSDRARVAALLASADVVVAPGPIETFGLAALEALACGTPVVVNAESALPEVVGNAGVAATGTGAAFADAISTVLARPENERRAAARARAEQFPWTKTVSELLALHERNLAHLSKKGAHAPRRGGGDD